MGEKPPLEQSKSRDGEQNCEKIKYGLQEAKDPRNVNHFANLIVLVMWVGIASIVTSPLPAFPLAMSNQRETRFVVPESSAKF